MGSILNENPISGALTMCHASSTSRARAPGSKTVWAGVAVLLLGSTAAFADDAPNLLTDSFQVALGTFILTSEPTIQLKGDTSNGDKVDFDEALGGGDSQRIRLDSLWRFGDTGRHKVKAIAFDMSRDNSRTFDRDIEWGGRHLPREREDRRRIQFYRHRSRLRIRLPQARQV